MKDFDIMTSIIAIIIVVVMFFGYCINIYKVFQCDFEAPYKAEVIRISGIVVPVIGAIGGYVDIKDGKE